MPDQSPPPTIRTLDRALNEAGTSGTTRRWLLERAAVGAAGVAAGGGLFPATNALAAGDARARRHPGRHDRIHDFGVVAVTTEALTVTLLAEVLRRANISSNGVPPGTLAVFEGAYAAEVDHFRFTRKYWHPTTTKFWIPDGFFGGSGNTLELTAIGNALVTGETLFVNLYLIGVTDFANSTWPVFARYCAELAGCESEHRVLAQTLIPVSPPNDVGFEVYSIHQPSGIEHALEQAGVGFGKQGSAAGAFYSLAHPIMKPPVAIKANHPT
jgi:hypothetical protein